MRRNWQDGVELVLEDFNAISKALERGLYDRVVYELIQRTENAVFGDGFTVSFAGGTSIVIKKGVGFQSDVSQVSPEPNKRLLFLADDSNKSLSIPDSANDRIDIVCIKNAIIDELSTIRKYKDAGTSAITNETVIVQKDWEAEIVIVSGTPGVTPVAPATPTGYIKIAECYVNAVVGMSDQNDITDSRVIMPLGALTTINTTGFQRLTVGASVSLNTLFSNIDALLKNGYFQYWDIDELVAHPAAPAASKRRLYFTGGVVYEQDSSGVKTPLGSGGGGGGGLVLSAPDGLAPLMEEENSVDVYKFASGEAQELDVFLKVPEGYLSGRQIKMFLGIYSPSAADTILMLSQSSLIRQNVDAVSAPISNRISINTALTNTVANMYRKVELDLTDVDGEIDGYAVSPGDLIKIKLYRGTDSDVEDIRLMPSSLEPKFS